MAYEKLTKRTFHLAVCECGFKDGREKNPPREIQCPICRKWLKYKEETWTGQDRFERSRT